MCLCVIAMYLCYDSLHEANWWLRLSPIARQCMQFLSFGASWGKQMTPVAPWCKWYMWLLIVTVKVWCFSVYGDCDDTSVTAAANGLLIHATARSDSESDSLVDESLRYFHATYHAGSVVKATQWYTRLQR